MIALAIDEGDQVCIDILLKQGEELGKTAQAMIRQLGMQKLNFDAVLAGSVVVKGSGSFLLAPIEAAVLAVAPLAQVKRLYKIYDDEKGLKYASST